MISQFFKPVPKSTRTLNDTDNIVDQPPKKIVKLNDNSISNDSFNAKVLDISLNCDKKPIQPIINFPRRKIGNKQRCFQSSWYKIYPWIEYSVQLDAIFCFYCRHFATSTSHEKQQDVLIVSGYSDWKNISGMTKKHNEANSHKTSFAKYQGFVTSKSVGAVTLQINSHVEENITKNRELLKSIIRSILYCARQDIGLRGHYNVNTSLNKDLENTEQTNNQGNLKELVDLLCLENEKFDKDLKSLPKNAKYTSNIVQNDILLASSNIITQTIVKEVNEGSSVYSLIVDEARDASTLEQMSICIRYVHKSIIKERFLGFVQVLKLDAQGLTHCIIEFLNAVGLDIEKCISQSYDGASVMSGSTNGVQIKIRELSKNKCPYIHCYAHRLNLVLVDVAKSVEIVDDTIGLLEAIYAFQSSSTLRHGIFSEVQKDCENVLKVPQHSDTRWVAKYKGIHFFLIRYENVIKALSICSKSSKKKEAAESKGLLNQFCSFNIVFVLTFLDNILLTVNTLSIHLQSSTLDIIKCLKLVEATKVELERLRSDEHFSNFYTKSEITASNLNISLSNHKKRRTNINSTLTDYVITSTTGFKNTDITIQNM